MYCNKKCNFYYETLLLRHKFRWKFNWAWKFYVFQQDQLTVLLGQWQWNEATGPVQSCLRPDYRNQNPKKFFWQNVWKNRGWLYQSAQISEHKLKRYIILSYGLAWKHTYLTKLLHKGSTFNRWKGKKPIWGWAVPSSDYSLLDS